MDLKKVAKTSSSSSTPLPSSILPVPWPIKPTTGPQRVALLGHSYVRRLRDYMDRNECPNLGFPGQGVRVETFCRGGGCLRLVPDDRWFNLLLQPALLFRPSVVYVHIGENDLNHLNIESLSDHLITFIRSIITLGHPDVIIVSQLFPMPVHVNRHNISHLNDVLSTAIDTLNQAPSVVAGERVTRLVFLRHRFGIWGSNSTSLFHSDGVHLSEIGVPRYYSSVHNAVGNALHSL